MSSYLWEISNHLPILRNNYFNNSIFALSLLLLKEGVMDSMTLMLLDKQKSKILCRVLGHDSSIHSRSNQSEVVEVQTCHSFCLSHMSALPPGTGLHSGLCGCSPVINTLWSEEATLPMALLYSFPFLPPLSEPPSFPASSASHVNCHLFISSTNRWGPWGGR